MSNSKLPPEKVAEIKEAARIGAQLQFCPDKYSDLFKNGYEEGATVEAQKAQELSDRFLEERKGYVALSQELATKEKEINLVNISLEIAASEIERLKAALAAADDVILRKYQPDPRHTETHLPDTKQEAQTILPAATMEGLEEKFDKACKISVIVDHNRGTAPLNQRLLWKNFLPAIQEVVASERKNFLRKVKSSLEGDIANHDSEVLRLKEQAKQEAIAFAEWHLGHVWKCDINELSTQELYTLFKEGQKQKEG